MNITITDSAVEKVKELINESLIGLRISIKGGGCGGLSYDFALETDISDDDIVVEKNDIKIIIDSATMVFLDGSIIDYVTEPFSERFVIINPNLTTCGCGESFQINA